MTDLHLFHPEPGAVRLLGYEDYRQIFMPIGREYVEGLLAMGEYHTDPEHVARLWAGHHAVEALLRPGSAAGSAIAYFARRMKALGAFDVYEEAAE